MNDSLIYAKEIVKLLRGIECRVNLIRFHAIPNVDLEGVDMETMVACIELDAAWRICYDPCFKRRRYFRCLWNVVNG